MSILEFVAAFCGFWAVLLTIYRKPLCWPVGLAQVLLYTIVFFRARLYSQVILQVVFAAMQLHGWWQWRQSSAKAADAVDDEVEVRSISRSGLIASLIAAMGITAVLGLVMSQMTDAALPFADAATAGFSLAAQWLMIHRYVENWWLWLVVNAISIYMFAAQGLWITAGLYILFFALAVIGAQAWHRRLDRNHESRINAG